MVTVKQIKCRGLRALAQGLALVVTLAGAITPCHGAQMTGVQLVRDMRADPAIGSNAIRRDQAMGYIAGVMDASAGAAWCPAGKQVPHEISYLVLDDIERLGLKRLGGAAAPLIIQVLAKYFPCNPPGAKR